jgi:hypothetical protein
MEPTMDQVFSAIANAQLAMFKALEGVQGAVANYNRIAEEVAGMLKKEKDKAAKEKEEKEKKGGK